jgi:hypothetical protein
VALVLARVGCTEKSAAQATVDWQTNLKLPFHFVAYGDTGFHDSKDSDAANPAVRPALVQAIAEANPAFICFTGDIVSNQTSKATGRRTATVITADQRMAAPLETRKSISFGFVRVVPSRVARVSGQTFRNFSGLLTQIFFINHTVLIHDKGHNPA